MKLKIRILIASVFVSLSVQAGKSADATGSDKKLPVASLLETAKKLDLKPIDLAEFNQQQQHELLDLWDATVVRSQDIQFVIHKFMANNNNEKTSIIFMRLISTAEFDYRGQSMIMTMGKRACLNEMETIMLYKIVRDTAEALASNYRNYSQVMHHLVDANDAEHALVCRDSLVGLAGEEAVTKLDESNGFTKLIKPLK